MEERTAPFHNISSLTLEAADLLANLALEKARAAGLNIHVSLVDASGLLLVYKRMELAPPPARLFSEGKAFTAVSFGKPTSVWKDRLNANPHLATGLSSHPQVTMIGGGAPLIAEGKVIGAIGVAGGLEEQDIALVQAVLESAQDLLHPAGVSRSCGKTSSTVVP